MTNVTHLGFPAPLLGSEAVRLPVLFDDGERLALLKPAGVLVQSDSWYPWYPVLVEAIRYQAGQSKPEMQRLNISPGGLWAVTNLDPDCQGPVLFARQREVAEEMRNVLGSEAYRFTFAFLSKGTHPEEAFDCRLPIARHAHVRKMLVSHTSGKKAVTHFRKIGTIGSLTEWEATTPYPRHHQIPLHASEAGIPVVGDPLYAKDTPVLLSRFKRNYSSKRDNEERPLYDGPACYLKEIRLENGLAIRLEDPPRWKGLLKQLEKHA